MKTVKAAADRFTARDYAALPEGFPAQLIEGCLVKEASPNYGHQAIVREICRRLEEVIDRRRVLPGPVDVPINEYNVYIPDVAVYEAPPRQQVGGIDVPVVVFEVISRTTESHDRGEKRRGYLESGVHEVWLVDPYKGTIEVQSPAGATVATGGERAIGKNLEGFGLTPADLFAEWRERP